MAITASALDKAQCKVQRQRMLEEQRATELGTCMAGGGIRISGATGPCAAKINGLYMCSQDNDQMCNGRKHYKRHKKGAVSRGDTWFRYDSGRWIVGQTLPVTASIFLLGYCEQTLVSDPTTAKRWYVNTGNGVCKRDPHLQVRGINKSQVDLFDLYLLQGKGNQKGTPRMESKNSGAPQIDGPSSPPTHKEGTRRGIPGINPPSAGAPHIEPTTTDAPQVQTPSSAGLHIEGTRRGTPRMYSDPGDDDDRRWSLERCLSNVYRQAGVNPHQPQQSCLADTTNKYFLAPSFRRCHGEDYRLCSFNKQSISVVGRPCADVANSFKKIGNAEEWLADTTNGYRLAPSIHCSYGEHYHRCSSNKRSIAVVGRPCANVANSFKKVRNPEVRPQSIIKLIGFSNRKVRSPTSLVPITELKNVPKRPLGRRRWLTPRHAKFRRMTKARQCRRTRIDPTLRRSPP